jgi:hypothetical protein
MNGRNDDYFNDGCGGSQPPLFALQCDWTQSGYRDVSDLLEHQSRGLGVGSSNLPAPTNKKYVIVQISSLASLTCPLTFSRPSDVGFDTYSTHGYLRGPCFVLHNCDSIGSSALIRAPIARSAGPATPAIQKGPAFHPGEYLRGQPGHATGADATPSWKQVAGGVSVDRGARQAGLQNNGPDAPELIMIWLGACFVRRRSYSVGVRAP